MSKRSGALAPGVAFITGGARGLGNAIAVSFAKEGARAVVLVDVLDEATLAEGKANVEKYGTECLTIHADVTKEADMQRAIQEAVAKYTRIDYAANFAGILGPSDPISSMSLDDWQKTQSVNATGIFIATKFEMQQMISQSPSPGIEEGRIQQQGSIINCASVNSAMTLPGSAAYTASKHACHGITKSAALEGRVHNIRVNAVSPGFLRTQLVAPVSEGTGSQDAAIREAGLKIWESAEARQGRRAQFEEVGDVVVLMSLPRMSLVTGQNLFIDGGFSVSY